MTQWSITQGPTVLDNRERGVTTISQFLSFFPRPQLIIYIIVELVVEECGQDGLLSPRQKQKIKVEDPNPYTSDAILNKDMIVKPEVYHQMLQKMTDILDRTRSDSIPDAIEIKFEGVEVCIFKFINAFKANNNISKCLNISEMIGSGCFTQHHQHKLCH